MKLKKIASAGSLESSDLLVKVGPAKKGREIAIQSIVALQFHDAIMQQVVKTLDEFGVDDVIVEINDMGAVDYVIKARLEVALNRAGGDE